MPHPERWQRVPYQAQGREQGSIDRHPPLLLGNLAECPRRRASGVDDEQIQAPEPLHGTVHGDQRSLVRRQIGNDRDATYLRGMLQKAIGRSGGNGNPRTLGRQGGGDGSADSATAAADEGT